jgi:transposase
LQQTLELDQPLATAYYLKEELRQLRKQKNKKKATAVLENWISLAKAARIKILAQLANSL